MMPTPPPPIIFYAAPVAYTPAIRAAEALRAATLRWRAVIAVYAVLTAHTYYDDYVYDAMIFAGYALPPAAATERLPACCLLVAMLMPPLLPDAAY